jgi:hypothetical protein
MFDWLGRVFKRRSKEAKVEHTAKDVPGPSAAVQANKAKKLLHQLEWMLSEAEHRVGRLDREPPGEGRDAELRSLKNTHIHLTNVLRALQPLVEKSTADKFATRIEIINKALKISGGN